MAHHNNFSPLWVYSESQLSVKLVRGSRPPPQCSIGSSDAGAAAGSSAGWATWDTEVWFSTQTSGSVWNYKSRKPEMLSRRISKFLFQALASPCLYADAGVIVWINHAAQWRQQQQYNYILSLNLKVEHSWTYLSLWPLLQSLQERGNIAVIINDELHVLTHNANGNILKGEIYLRNGLHTNTVTKDYNILNPS